MMMNFRVLGVMAGGFAMLLAGANAEAMGHDMQGMEMAASASSNIAVAAETSSTRAFKAADARMHKDMMATAYTGDADVDFLRSMIPHHQGAVDMAKVVIQYGTDPDVRMLAGDIVKAQEKEIRWMKDWLAKHGPTMVPDAKASDMRVDVPVVSATTVVAKAPATDAVVKAVDMVSGTGATSGTLVTSTTPPTDAVSATTAMRIGEPTGLPGAITGSIDDAMPSMPAPNEAIDNAAPKMEFLDGPGLGTPAQEQTN